MSLASACAMAYTVTTAHGKRLGADEELCEKCLPGMELPLWYFRVLSTDRYNIFSQMARDISARIHKGRLLQIPCKMPGLAGQVLGKLETMSDAEFAEVALEAAE